MSDILKNRKKIYFHSCEKMDEIESNSAKLIMLSPPFTHNADQKTLNKESYLSFLSRIFIETYRILEISGTLVTVSTDLRDHAKYNKDKNEYEGTVWFKHVDLLALAKKADFKCVEYKIWIKSLGINLYRYNFAFIMVFSKKGTKPVRPGIKRNNVRFLRDAWLLEGGVYRKSSDGFVFRNAFHPEIAELCIDEFTRPGDLVVSPFSGSGTILAVAELMGRSWVGYEINARLKGLINESIYGPNRPAIYKNIEKRYLIGNTRSVEKEAGN